MTDGEWRLCHRLAMAQPYGEAGLSRRRLLQALVASLAVNTTDGMCQELPRARRFQNVVLTGEWDERWAALDEFLLDFVGQHDVPGAAIAVAKDERILYARGIGYISRQVPVPVLPTSRFRIASISKPLTALAIARFVEQGIIEWDSPVCDLLARHPQLEHDVGHVRDKRWYQITVRHVLQHRGGWDRQQSFDPMFRSVHIALAQGVSPPATAADIIRYMFRVPLDFDPGERAAYSNFGYCVLGRVLEAVAGRPYAEVVGDAVLVPCGARQTELGKTRQPADFEVGYDDDENGGYSVFADNLGAPVPAPYGAWCLEAMDAHGGWIASAPDLLHISIALHRAASPLLSAETRQVMFARPEGPAGWETDGTPKATYFGCGWMVRPVNHGFNCWHTGSLPGTSTILVRRWDNLHWAVLFNRRRSRDGKPLAQVIDPLLHPLIEQASKS